MAAVGDGWCVWRRWGRRFVRRSAAGMPGGSGEYACRVEGRHKRVRSRGSSGYGGDSGGRSDGVGGGRADGELRCRAISAGGLCRLRGDGWCYWADVDAQAQRAEAELDRLVATQKAGEKLALVLDIDETSLSNYCEMKREDYGFLRRCSMSGRFLLRRICRCRGRCDCSIRLGRGGWRFSLLRAAGSRRRDGEESGGRGV